jgi:hypothetical protein
MKSFLIMSGLAVAIALGAENASAQIIGPSALPPPQPPPLPGPKIEVPKVPKLDELPERNYVPAAPRPSFSDKVNTCLDEAAANELAPADRDSYVRACANSR